MRRTFSYTDGSVKYSKTIINYGICARLAWGGSCTCKTRREKLNKLNSSERLAFWVRMCTVVVATVYRGMIDGRLAVFPHLYVHTLASFSIQFVRWVPYTIINMCRISISDLIDIWPYMDIWPANWRSYAQLPYGAHAPAEWRKQLLVVLIY
jgi:hypothetical protein